MWPWEQQQINAQATPVAQPEQIPTQELPGLSFVVEPTPSWLPEKRPPATPEEFEQRKSVWQGILDRIQNDPMLRQTLLTVGVRMMQGRRPGQTTAGAIGEAIGLGAMHYGMLEQNAKMEKAQAEEQARKNRETDANVELRKSQAKENEAQAERIKTLTEVEKDIKLLEQQKKQAEIALQNAIERADPGGVRRAQLALAEIEQRLAREKAQTASANASAAASFALAGERNQETKLRDILMSPTASEDEKARARDALARGAAKGGSVDSAQVKMLEAFKENYRKMNPGASEQEVAKAAYDWYTRMKERPTAQSIVDYVNAGIITAKEGRAWLKREGLLPTDQIKPADKPVDNVIVREIK